MHFVFLWYYTASVGRPGATGTPEECFLRGSRASSVSHLHMPTTEELVYMYQQRGGQITSSGKFGWDPLSDDEQLVREREQRMEVHCPTYEDCFNGAVRGDHAPLQQTILGCIRITLDIVNSL